MNAPLFPHTRRGLLLAVTAWLGLLLAGCQTPATFPTPTATWQTYTGQAHYAGSRSVVGEVVVRRSGASEFQLAFASGPGFPLLQLKESGRAARAEGLLARGSWQGNPASAPAHLQAWVALREVFAAVPAAGGAFAGQGWKAQAVAAGGRLQHLVVEYPSSGERITFHLSR